MRGSVIAADCVFRAPRHDHLLTPSGRPHASLAPPIIASRICSGTRLNFYLRQRPRATGSDGFSLSGSPPAKATDRARDFRTRPL